MSYYLTNTGVTDTNKFLFALTVSLMFLLLFGFSHPLLAVETVAHTRKLDTGDPPAIFCLIAFLVSYLFCHDGRKNQLKKIQTRYAWRRHYLGRDWKRTIMVITDLNILGEETTAAIFKRVRPKIEAIELPIGYSLEWGGEFEM